MEQPKSGISWRGFNVEGDSKSIDEVRRLIHAEDRLKWFEKEYARMSQQRREFDKGQHAHGVTACPGIDKCHTRAQPLGDGRACSPKCYDCLSKDFKEAKATIMAMPEQELRALAIAAAPPVSAPATPEDRAIYEGIASRYFRDRIPSAPSEEQGKGGVGE